MRRSASEKMEIINIVRDSEIGVIRTLKELGINKSTFYGWYNSYLENGFDGLKPKQIKRKNFWNHIPDKERQEVVEYALEESLKDVDRKTILTDANVFRNLFDDEIVQAIESLPDDYRVVVLLCDIESFSYKEISDILDIPIGTVMSRISRGRKMLQKSLLDYAKKEGYISNQ